MAAKQPAQPQGLLGDPQPESCPAYGHQCDCPATSAIRRICERTAADKR